MGKRDVKDREYFSEPRRFCELFNHVVFQGDEQLLYNKVSRYEGKYPTIGNLNGELERDILMKYTDLPVYFGLEIESESDYGMPERLLDYDVGEYEKQIRKRDNAYSEAKAYSNFTEKKSRMKKGDTICPVINVVLYLGEGKWQGRRQLSEMYSELPHKMKLYLDKHLQDYRFILVEVDYMNPDYFRTELRHFIRAMQCRNDKSRLYELLQSEEFSGLSEDTEIEIALHLNMKKLQEKVEGGKKMCRALKELLEDEHYEGKKEGIEEGIKEGIKEGTCTVVKNMILEGLDRALILRVTNCSEEEYDEVLSGLA